MLMNRSYETNTKMAHQYEVVFVVVIVVVVMVCRLFQIFVKVRFVMKCQFCHLSNVKCTFKFLFLNSNFNDMSANDSSFKK